MEKYISMLLVVIVLTATIPNISELPKDDSYTAIPLNNEENINEGVYEIE